MFATWPESFITDFDVPFNIEYKLAIGSSVVNDVKNAPIFKASFHQRFGKTLSTVFFAQLIT